MRETIKTVTQLRILRHGRVSKGNANERAGGGVGGLKGDRPETKQGNRVEKLYIPKQLLLSTSFGGGFGGDGKMMETLLVLTHQQTSNRSQDRLVRKARKQKVVSFSYEPIFKPFFRYRVL